MSRHSYPYIFELRGHIENPLQFNRYNQISETDYNSLLIQIGLTPCQHFIPTTIEFPSRLPNHNLFNIQVFIRIIDHRITQIPVRVHTPCEICQESPYTTVIEISRYYPETFDISSANDDFDNFCVVIPTPRLILD